ncbi:inactive pancreatic lipase-related protein 1-like [Pelodytes ibericus]
MPAIWILAIYLLGTVKGTKLCTGQENKQCFEPRPLYPAFSIVRFLLHTRKNLDHYQEISPKDKSTISTSHFNPEKFTRILIHGYTDNGEVPWLKEMCQTLLKVEDSNCIIVGWGAASLTIYLQATQTIRFVGSEVAHLLREIKEMYNYPACKIHVIGHSLGAHAAGFVGKLFKDIGRITGLGIIAAIGDYDFYPNGGSDMKECNKSDAAPYLWEVVCIFTPFIGPINCSKEEQQAVPPCPENLKNASISINTLKEHMLVIFCDHYQAVKYYINSITNKDLYKSYPCETHEKFKAGEKLSISHVYGDPVPKDSSYLFPAARNNLDEISLESSFQHQRVSTHLLTETLSLAMEPTGITKAITPLTRQIAVITQYVQDLQVGKTRLQHQMHNLQATAVPVMAPVPVHSADAAPEPRIPLPERFTGDHA